MIDCLILLVFIKFDQYSFNCYFFLLLIIFLVYLFFFDSILEHFFSLNLYVKLGASYFNYCFFSISSVKHLISFKFSFHI